jgi:hypothetical protein
MIMASHIAFVRGDTVKVKVNFYVFGVVNQVYLLADILLWHTVIVPVYAKHHMIVLGHFGRASCLGDKSILRQETQYSVSSQYL